MRLQIALLVVLVPATAAAGPLADALARPDDAAITALRARLPDVGARCTLGAIYAKRNDLTRAGLYLTDCGEADLPGEIAAPVGKIARDMKKKLGDGDLSAIQVSTTPEGLTAESTALPGEPFQTPATLWVKPGTYEVRAVIEGMIVSSTVTTKLRERGLVTLAVPPKKKQVDLGPKDHKVNFDDEEAGEKQTTAPPPDVKHPNLMAPKFRGARAMLEAGEVAGEPILVDPLATLENKTVRPHRAYWLGVRLGGGMFDDGGATARPGMSLAATGRYPIVHRAFLAARLDWSRRGGELAMASSIDALGASAGVGITVLDHSSLALALIGQLRGDVRFASERLDQSVSRAGLGAALGFELALPSTPITAGLRVEQGLTRLADSRDRAVLIEVGVDWR